MLKFSTNLTAELVGMAATAQRRGEALGIRASAQEMSRWARRFWAWKGQVWWIIQALVRRPA